MLCLVKCSISGNEQKANFEKGGTEIIEGKRQVFSSYEIIQFSVEFSGSVVYQKTNMPQIQISCPPIVCIYVCVCICLNVYTHTYTTAILYELLLPWFNIVQDILWQVKGIIYLSVTSWKREGQKTLNTKKRVLL